LAGLGWADPESRTPHPPSLRLHLAECSVIGTQARSRNRPKPPEWFTKKDYQYLRRLNARGWLRELERCKKIRDAVSLRKWGTETAVPSFIGPPVVEIVEKADQATLPRIERPALILKVYLRAPDGKIIEEFKRALQNARRSTPSPVKKPGPQGLDAVFMKTEFSHWLDHRIVELCELDVWRGKERKKKPRKRLPRDADFGHWLFPAYVNQRKKVISARKALGRAITQIPALWAQVEGGSVPVD